MLAETLAAKGYEKVGFSENPIAGPGFRLDQGFERWLKNHDTSRPYFLFINLADAHLPREHRAYNRFLSAKLSAQQQAGVGDPVGPILFDVSKSL